MRSSWKRRAGADFRHFPDFLTELASLTHQFLTRVCDVADVRPVKRMASQLVPRGQMICPNSQTEELASIGQLGRHNGVECQRALQDV